MNILSVQVSKWMICGMALLVPLASIAYYVLAASDRVPFLSEESLVSAYQQFEPQAKRPLYYLNYLPVSASFYARGAVGKLSRADTIPGQAGYWLAVHKTLGDAAGLGCQRQYQPSRGVFDLYLCNGEKQP
jgi:hypothetical protein